MNWQIKKKTKQKNQKNQKNKKIKTKKQKEKVNLMMIYISAVLILPARLPFTLYRTTLVMLNGII